MNEASPPNPTPRDLSLSSLTNLEYAMAGDLESVEFIQNLWKRFRAIDWNDPAFVAFTREMQGQAGLPLGCDEQSASELRSLTYSLIQRNAERDEMITATDPVLRQAKAHLEKTCGYNIKLLLHIKTLCELHVKMSDQLQSMGADVSDYVFPDLPKHPILQ